MARKTAEELLAEAQARVAALEAKAEARKQRAIESLIEDRTKLVQRISADTDKVEAIDTELIELGYEWPTLEDEATESFATNGVVASV
jgi:polyhydroxyalkanoate synthesis regulator phasin